MITQYDFGARSSLPEISPFVTTPEVQLKMVDLGYQKLKAMPPAPPMGQLPYIGDEGEGVADSTFVGAPVERKYDFETATACAHESMTNRHEQGFFAQVGALLHTWRERRRQRRELARWNERDLHDVGLSWSDIAYEVEKPFWRA